MAVDFVNSFVKTCEMPRGFLSPQGEKRRGIIRDKGMVAIAIAASSSVAEKERFFRPMCRDKRTSGRRSEQPKERARNANAGLLYVCLDVRNLVCVDSLGRNNDVTSDLYGKIELILTMGTLFPV